MAGLYEIPLIARAANRTADLTLAVLNLSRAFIQYTENDRKVWWLEQFQVNVLNSDGVNVSISQLNTSCSYLPCPYRLAEVVDGMLLTILAYFPLVNLTLRRVIQVVSRANVFNGTEFAVPSFPTAVLGVPTSLDWFVRTAFDTPFVNLTALLHTSTCRGFWAPPVATTPLWFTRSGQCRNHVPSPCRLYRPGRTSLDAPSRSPL